MKMRVSGCLALAWLLCGTAAAAAPLQYRGVNLAGAEFGSNVPGTHGTDYIYPDPAYTNYTTADYYLAKGMNTFRLPFRWERLQRTRGAAFDAAELTRLRTTVNRLLAKGAYVLLDPHNYARYGAGVIGESVPYSDFGDFWSRLAQEFKGNPRIIFGIMNEPYSMRTETWVTAANTAIQAIRATGATNLILVPGNGWTGAHSWSSSYYGTPNAIAMLQVSDPGNNMAFEVHQYLDSDSSGTSSTCVSSTIGGQRMQNFTNWLRANGKRGFLGEFGGGRDSVCAAAIDNIVDHLEANADVYLGWTYWAGGPWWGNYFSTLEPAGGVDRPQMDALESHLATTPTCTSATYEAESIYHSNGGTVTGGWSLWGNGYFSTSHAFSAGSTTLTVTASGDPASGVWPHMVVSVGGVQVGSVYVSSRTWTQYSFTFNATAGTKEIRLTFDNDTRTSTEDRNLKVDKFVVGCPSP